MGDVTAVILCGGLGTRLYPAVSDRPKCLAEVNGKPFIFYLLDQIANAGIECVVLAVDYKWEMIDEIVGDEYRDMVIGYSVDTVEGGGTGAALRSALPCIDDPHVLVMNGDTYIDMKLFNFLCEYQIRNGNTGFVLNLYVGIVNMGMYLTYYNFIREHIPQNTPYSLEKSFLKDVYKYGIIPYVINKPFIDIGTPKSYAIAGEFMDAIA